MDMIQPYKGDAHPPSSSRPPASAVTVMGRSGCPKNHLPLLEGAAHRFWMVLAVAVPMAIVSSIMVFRLPPVYVVKAEIEINPPQIDPTLSALLSHEIGRSDPATPSQLHPQPRSAAQESARWPSGW